MNDLISRRAAIDALMSNEPSAWNNDDYERGEIARFHEDVTTIKNVPSVRRKGKPSAQSEPEEFEWCTDCKEYDQEAHCCHRWTKVIRNTVEEIKNIQPEPGWIPVEEGLPKAGTRYQVTFESGEVGYADFRNKIFLWDGSAKENVWETERYYEDDGEVIAWMPLPKRYERNT